MRCLVRDDLEDADAMTIPLIENVRSADMHPLEKARTLQRLYEQGGEFKMRHCGGTSCCEVIRDILMGELDESGFEGLVRMLPST